MKLAGLGLKEYFADTFNRLVAGIDPRDGEAHALPEESGSDDVVLGGLTGPDVTRDRSPSPSPQRGTGPAQMQQK